MASKLTGRIHAERRNMILFGELNIHETNYGLGRLLMELTISKDYFNEALSDVSRAVTTKSLLPILTGIKLVAKEDCLILIGSNSNIAIEKIIPLEMNGIRILNIDETGSAVLPAKYLCEVVKKLSDDIHIKVTGNNVAKIQSDEVMVYLNGFNPGKYPTYPSIKTNHFIQIHSSALMEIIKQTTFAVSKSETRPVLTGVNMSFKENKLTCVATNSHRLALRKVPINSQIEASFIVPGASLTELTKLMNNEKDLIHIYILDNYIVFKSSTTSLYSRLIEGNFPGISKLIPADSKTVMILDTVKLLKGIDRARLFASEWKNNNILIEMIDGKQIKIASNSTDMGKIEEIMDIRMVQGEINLSISLDGEFLLDALKAIKEKEVKLSFGGSLRPVLIEPVNNPSHLHLISPVRSY
ncbi:DNA polymerase III subunit beta [Bacillus sp. E214]|uniref:DNA polymerase III subunit beta n=2 Tax=Bacillales TaxID=1385 RepID=UPI0021CCCD18|nr:DNA polymerase III subunit beta [Bacillus sp. E214]